MKQKKKKKKNNISEHERKMGTKKDAWRDPT
jgi:hypothetical protein